MLSVFALLGACQELNHPPDITDYESSTYSDPCLAASVDAPVTVKSGRVVDVKVSFKNTCESPHSFVYESVIYLILTNKDSDVVWQADAGSVSPDVIRGKELAPGETITFDFRWNGRDGWNKRLAAGKYSFVGIANIISDENGRVSVAGRLEALHTIDIR